MSENGPADSGDKAQPQQQGNQVQMRVIGQYVRDLSFENVVAQKGSAPQGQPDINVQVNLDARKRPQENTYESSIKLNIESKAKDSGDVLFLLEIDYTGLFHIEGVPEDQMHPFLLIECPRMIFPFLRRVVSDVTSDGGFPPLNLDNIDFLGIYRNELARRQAEAQAPDQKTDA